MENKAAVLDFQFIKYPILRKFYQAVSVVEVIH